MKNYISALLILGIGLYNTSCLSMMDDKELLRKNHEQKKLYQQIYSLKYQTTHSKVKHPHLLRISPQPKPRDYRNPMPQFMIENENDAPSQQ